MADGRGEFAWGQTALLATLLVNAHRDPRKARPARVSDFNPYMKGCPRQQAILVDKSSIHLLRKAFEGRA